MVQFPYDGEPPEDDLAIVRSVVDHNYRRFVDAHPELVLEPYDFVRGPVERVPEMVECDHCAGAGCALCGDLGLVPTGRWRDDVWTHTYGWRAWAVRAGETPG